MERAKQSQLRDGKRVALWLSPAVLALLLAAAVISGRQVAADTSSLQPNRAGEREAPTMRSINYAYDGAGRLVRADYGDGKAIVYTYDAAGNLLQRMVVARVPLYLPIMLKG